MDFHQLFVFLEKELDTNLSSAEKESALSDPAKLVKIIEREVRTELQLSRLNKRPSRDRQK